MLQAILRNILMLRKNKTVNEGFLAVNGGIGSINF